MSNERKFTISELQQMRESEDHIEFKRGEGGNISYNGKGKDKPNQRRRCILGYVAALCNEGGGRIVIGMDDKHPHAVIGTTQCEHSTGQLESDIYRDMGIRPFVYELFEQGTHKRVLVIEVPKRPVGKVYKFEDVALMRVGEELKPMDYKTYISIIQEQEPDFSEQYCGEASIADLDPVAIEILKEKYAKKQNNPAFTSLSNKQALSDLKLIDGDKVTNAAVLLVGKESFLQSVFPQAKVMLEYRGTASQINFDNRISFGQPFFILIDKLWEAINLRNGTIPIREGAYIFDVQSFNEDVIREFVNNAFAHRDYRRNSEIVIKQYPNKLVIQNAGGFPQGVTLDNLLTVPSTPRNRLLADVLSKTGVVERSGQGMDKIFLYTLSEGKPAPDFSHSDDFTVTGVLLAHVQDKAFAMYVQKVQQELPDDKKLNVFDVIALCEVRDGAKHPTDKLVAKKLEQLGLLEKHGKTNAQYYILPRAYHELSGDTAKYSLMTDWDMHQVWAVVYPYLQKYGKAKKSDIVTLCGNHLSDKQLRRFIDELKAKGMLKTEGERRQMVYMIGDSYLEKTVLLDKALKIGLEKLLDKGEEGKGE